MLLGVLLLAAVGALGWLLARQSPAPADPLAEVSATEEPAEPVHVVPTGEPIRVALASTVDASDLEHDLEPLRIYLERTVQRPVAWVFASSYEGTAALLTSGQVPFASLTPALYIKTQREFPDIELVAAKRHKGTVGSDGILLVRTDLGVTDITELKGKRLCYTDQLSTTGYLLPRGFLKKQGLDPDVDFGSSTFSGNHMKLIQDLEAGVCDVGGTFREMMESARSKGVDMASFRVFAITGHTPHDAICAAPGTDAGLIEDARAALLAFDPMKELGQESLGKVEQLIGFELVSDAVYDDLRRVIE
jgi:phosphonate transport system substrate-binding protein